LICIGVVSIFAKWLWPTQLQTYLALFASGLVGLALGDTLLFVSLKSMGVQKTSVIQCLAPPFAALMAWGFFQEVLVVWEWVGLLVTVSFLALILKARTGTQQQPMTPLGLCSALGAALCQAFAMTSLRWSLQGVDVWSGTLLRIVPSILALFLYASFVARDLSHMTRIFTPRRNALLLTAAAFLGTFLGLILMSTGVKYSKAGVATALSSTTPVWILPVAHFMLGEKMKVRLLLLTVGAVLGVALMILGPYLL